MNDSKVMAQLLAPISLHLRAPHEPDSPSFRAWLATYEEILSGFEADVLAHAAQKICKTWRRRSFPLPAELLDVCDEARSELRPRPPLLTPAGTDPAAAKAWLEARTALERTMGKVQYSCWAKHLTPLSYDGQAMRLRAATPWKAEFLTNNKLAQLEAGVGCQVQVLRP